MKRDGVQLCLDREHADSAASESTDHRQGIVAFYTEYRSLGRGWGIGNRIGSGGSASLPPYDLDYVRVKSTSAKKM